MFKKNKILAIIPARAGSKGLKNKNIVDFAGKPLINWTIQSSCQSRYIDRTIVTTDSEEIAQIAREAGADVPFLRPAALATDRSPVMDALKHCLDWLVKKEKSSYDYVLILQPTAPLRTVQHIDEAIAYYFNNRKTNADTLVSVVSAPKKMMWLLVEGKKGYVDFSLKDVSKNSRRQDLPNSYFPNGVIFLGPTKAVRKSGFYSKCTLPFVMEENISVDIDTEEDLQRALDLFHTGKYSGMMK